MNIFTKLWTFITGDSAVSTASSVAQAVAQTVEDYIPSDKSKHDMQVQDQQIEETSQSNARTMVLTSSSGFVNWCNGMIRPIFAIWAFCVLAGVIPSPTLAGINPVVLNIIWTIIGFYFGTRTLMKDLPQAIAHIRSSASK